jgi:hypothetical protein
MLKRGNRSGGFGQAARLGHTLAGLAEREATTHRQALSVAFPVFYLKQPLVCRCWLDSRSVLFLKETF